MRTAARRIALTTDRRSLRKRQTQPVPALAVTDFGIALELAWDLSPPSGQIRRYGVVPQ